MNAQTVPGDSEIAVILAAELIREQPVAPFKLAIYYDAQKEPPRVKVHRVIRGGTMGAVEFTSASAARRWAEEALREGYRVIRIYRYHDESEHDVATYRRHLEHTYARAAMTPEQRKIEDDEIPF